MSNLRIFDPLFPDNFESTMRRFLSPAAFDGDIPHMKMRVDLAEDDQAYSVHAEIPGVRKEDISVRIDGNVVQIDAEARQDKEEKRNGNKLLRSERYYGTISRTFSLAQDVDEAKVDAKYADGVLKLRLPKKASAESRRITIQ